MAATDNTRCIDGDSAGHPDPLASRWIPSLLVLEMSVLAALNGRRGDQHRPALSVLRTVGIRGPTRSPLVESQAHFSAEIRAVLVHAKVSMRSTHSNSGQHVCRTKGSRCRVGA
jgi:hypothetical protein